MTQVTIRSSSRRMRSDVRSCLRAVALGLLLGSSTMALPAGAQTRAASVKDVDAPGRVPYEYAIEWTRYGCSTNCSALVAYNGRRAFQFDGVAVPAGKRFIVQSVTATLPSSGSATAVIALNNSQSDSLYRPKWSFFGPFFATTQGTLGMTSAAFATIEAGQSPHVYLDFAGNPTNNFVFVTLSGYLIDTN